MVERMRSGGFNFGGEQSGHLVLGDHSTTGDGLISALQVLAILIYKREPASKICHVFEPTPQIMHNIEIGPGKTFDNEEVRQVIAKAETLLEKEGRLLVRKSGTEPLVRIMVEGTDHKVISSVSEELVETIKKACQK